MHEGHWAERRALRRRFDAAAGYYDQAAVLQREIGRRLVERLELIRLAPQRVLDLGSGTGGDLPSLRRRYRKAQLIAVDLSPAMLRHARRRGRWRALPVVCADAQALPLADHSVDLVYSNGMLHWCRELPALFRELKRVLRPGGLLLFATYGPDTLRELRRSWAQVDAYEHVNTFADMHDIGDLLLRTGFADPVMDMEYVTLTYTGLADLIGDLRQLGETQILGRRRRGLLGRGQWHRLERAYAQWRRPDGTLPATWEVVYGHAWATDRLVQERGADGSVAVSLDAMRRALRGGS